LFWRNLIDPYAREWQNQCGRWDLLDVVRATYALRPEGIAWPSHEDGRPSFKLEHISAANGLVHEAAHDALSDVRATIALARLIKQKQPKLFEFCLSLRKKETVRFELSLHLPRPVLHVSGMYGVERGNLALVWPLGEHPVNKNEVIVWDLAYDPMLLKGLSPEAIRERMFTRSDELPEGVQRLPIKSIHLNKSPFVVSNLKVLSPERAAHWGLDLDAAMRHAEIAQRLPDLSTVWRSVYQRPQLETPDVDENLYGGFVSNADRNTLARLRGMSAPLLAGSPPSFQDVQLGRLVQRYRARNFPASLTEAELIQWQAWCRKKLQEGVPPGRTHTQYQEEIAALEVNADERGQTILAALRAYGEMLS
jgi:exodeoxyribonuclease-1